MNNVYQNKVELLIRLMPYVMNEGVFAVQWKLLNLAKLKKTNPAKLQSEVERLRLCFM